MSATPTDSLLGSSVLTAVQAQENMYAEAKVTELPYAQFLLVYLDADGQIRLQTSGPIADNCHKILSMSVIDAFLEAAQISRENCFRNSQGNFHYHLSNDHN